MASSVQASLGAADGACRRCGAPNECSIALLPLRNLSGAREDEPLCAGITGDIIHNLTRFRDLTVIAQHSALQINALALAPREIAERLGVRYVLLGHLQRSGRGLQVQARLIEADSEQVVWSMEFDGPLGDVFAFQDEVTEVIAVHLAAEIRAAELRRAVEVGACRAVRIRPRPARPVSHPPVPARRQLAGAPPVRTGQANRSGLRSQLCRPVADLQPGLALCLGCRSERRLGSGL